MSRQIPLEFIAVTSTASPGFKHVDFLPLFAPSTFSHHHSLHSSQPCFVWIVGKANEEGPDLGQNSSFLFAFPPLPPSPHFSLPAFCISSLRRLWKLRDHFQIQEEDIITAKDIRTQFNHLSEKTGRFKICINVAPENRF